MKNCRVSDFSDAAKQQLLYSFSQQNADRWLELSTRLDADSAVAMQLHSALVKSYAAKKGQLLDSRGFIDSLYEHGLPERFISTLSDPLYFSLLDTHEAIQTDELGNRKQEQASVPLTDNVGSRQIYQTFVDLAKLRLKDASKPRIAVVTASSRDPFESADFYLSAFDSLGAEVVWLPLDASYQKARYLETLEVNGCEQLASVREQFDSFERERIYPLRTALQVQYCQQPELLHDLLKNIQGIFFNGGDQSRTLAALLDPLGNVSAELAIIRQQMQTKQLIIGGTSAGTAVQSGGFMLGAPVPMITSGQSGAAMLKGAFPISAPSERCLQDCTDALTASDLTYRPQGGTGLFNLGIVDTHFSERDREARLAVLAAESNQRFGFGVDETTAMLVNFEDNAAQIKVIGSNGVFMIDRAGGQYQVFQGDDVASGQRQITGTAHYLPTGSTGQYDFVSKQWQFELGGEALTSRKKLREADDGEWRNQTRQWCGTGKMVQWQRDDYLVAMHANESTKVHLVEVNDTRHCAYTHWPFLISRGQVR